MDKKWALQSITIWGVIITLLGALNIPIPVAKEEGEAIIHALFEIIGIITTVIGRMRATQPIGFFRK